VISGAAVRSTLPTPVPSAPARAARPAPPPSAATSPATLRQRPSGARTAVRAPSLTRTSRPRSITTTRRAWTTPVATRPGNASSNSSPSR